MKDFIKGFLNSLWKGDRLSWAITLIVVVVVLWAIAAGLGYFKQAGTDRDIKSTQTQAANAVNQAVQSESNAADASVERKTEDAIREKTIAPKLDTARRNSRSSKTALDEAKRKYNEKTDPQNLNSSRADNCLRLKRDFPDTAFEYCND